MSFTSALSNVLMCLFYIIPGFIVEKLKKAKPEHLSTVSAILIYIGTPFLEVSSLMSLDFSVELLRQMGLFFVITFLLQANIIGIMSLLLRKKMHLAKYRIMASVAVMGNTGFFGLPIVRALLPNNPEVVAFATVTMLSMNMLTFTFGVYCFTGERKYMSLRSAICNPTTLGFAIGFVCFALGLKNYLPSLLLSGISNVANMTLPMCMFVLGIRLAAAPIKSIFTDRTVWIIVALKLIAVPLFCFGIVSLLPLSYAFRAAVVILMATPCAAIALTLSEMYDSLPSLSANCITVSTLLCFLTIPLFTLLF